MKSIYKYEINPSDPVVIMPELAKLLHVDKQGDRMFVWAIVSTEECDKTPVQFYVYGTGHTLQPDIGRYVGTVTNFLGGLVFHIFVDDKALVEIQR